MVADVVMRGSKDSLARRQNSINVAFQRQAEAGVYGGAGKEGIGSWCTVLMV
jgi:hypothetical protein